MPSRFLKYQSFWSMMHGLVSINMLANVDRLKEQFAAMTQEERFQWAARQTYITIGIAAAAAAVEKIDATPMEGYLISELDKLLGLREKGLRSTTLMALGYRDTANDWLANLKKVRRPKEELIIEIN
ncbi:MAG TPA: nitroreductase family protein [Patescibacteria group bacterium]